MLEQPADLATITVSSVACHKESAGGRQVNSVEANSAGGRGSLRVRGPCGISSSRTPPSPALAPCCGHADPLRRTALGQGSRARSPDVERYIFTDTTKLNIFIMKYKSHICISAILPLSHFLFEHR